MSIVTNWGKYPIVETDFIEVSSEEEIIKAVKNNESVIVRGNGRSYGDNSLNKKAIISTLRLNKFISFDRDKGVFECESGVLLSEILETIIPQGFFLPITPGTKFITIGGAIGADVHGKNNHMEGCFSDYLIDFDIIIESGEKLTCSREKNSELFWRTIGGMGLTGIITKAKINLKPIKTAYIRNESIKAHNLDEIFKYFEESEEWTYTVAWIDCLQKGDKIGRSILMRGEHAEIDELPEKYKKEPLKIKPKLKLNVPFTFPSFVLNNLTVRIFNFLFYEKQLEKHLKNIIDYETFYYPLDAIYNWNRIYGKNGFIQYQFIIPKETGKEGMKRILKTIADSGQGSFLAVLKLYRKSDDKAYNSFPIDGYSIALDFKRNDKLKDLVVKLDDIVEEYGGRIYLAKDAVSKKSLVDYVKVPETNKFSSVQHERIFNKDISG